MNEYDKFSLVLKTNKFLQEIILKKFSINYRTQS